MADYQNNIWKYEKFNYTLPTFQARVRNTKLTDTDLFSLEIKNFIQDFNIFKYIKTWELYKNQCLFTKNIKIYFKN